LLLARGGQLVLANWLYNWQTLIGSVLASLIAVGSAAVAWKAATRQISAVQSERQRREAYAAALAAQYLRGVKEVHAKVKRLAEIFSEITQDRWRSEPEMRPKR
jgi:hypothetical protein